MPLTEENLFAVTPDGSRSGDCCCKDGQFSDSGSMEDMIEFCVPLCVKEGVYPDAETARAAMRRFFPTLKRWKK